MSRVLPIPIVSSLSEFVATHLGLNFPEERWDDLDRCISAVAQELGHSSTESCVRWLLSESVTQSDIAILAGQLTIGETYFFREKQSLDALEHYILPGLLRRNEGNRSIRIWSAGCCTGEEPYSIAILLDQLMPKQKGWKVDLIASDVNPKFLQKAAHGIYSEWSFRETPEWVKDKYFRKLKDGRRELLQHIKEKVTFSCVNLADDVYPSNITNKKMDVIICRNVLLYFTANHAKRVVNKFQRSLVDDGWLIVSPTDISYKHFSPLFTLTEFPGAAIYQKNPDTTALQLSSKFSSQPDFFHSETLSSPSVIPEQEQHSAEPWKSEKFDNLLVASREQDSFVQNDVDELKPSEDVLAMNVARSCANKGQLAEAIDWCNKAINIDKLNPAHYYLLATIQQESGEIAAAVQSLMRALYLDSGFILARFALGNIESARARYREAERQYRIALETLRPRAQTEILPESDGMTVGRVAEIIMSALEKLPRTTSFE
jgi:chemotaxis protein methyltransferase CheR